ncbi:hypothetical protein AB3S75_025254 [Citrus x aurantiifolia]
MLTLSPSSPTLAGTPSLPLISLTTLLLHSLSTTPRLLLSLATTPDLLDDHWSSVVAARSARWCCSLSSSLSVSLLSLARYYSRSTLWSLVAGRWSLLCGAARLSPSTMFSLAANLISLSPCKF